MLAPLNNIIPDIATKNKVAKTNDFCGSLSLFAINVQELLEMINKPNTSFPSLSVHDFVFSYLLGYS